MKKLLMILMLTLSSPALAQNAPADAATVKELVEILLPKASYQLEKEKLLTEVQKHFEGKFTCLGEDAKLNAQVKKELEDIFSYEAMTAQMGNLFDGLTEQDIIYIRAFYTSDTGAKWAQIQAEMQQAAERAGASLGEDVGKRVIPLIAENEQCVKLAKEQAEKEKAAAPEEGKKE